MMGFFFICEYLNITPKEFFDFESKQPELLDSVIGNLKKLNKRQLRNIAEIAEDLAKK